MTEGILGKVLEAIVRLVLQKGLADKEDLGEVVPRSIGKKGLPAGLVQFLVALVSGKEEVEKGQARKAVKRGKEVAEGLVLAKYLVRKGPLGLVEETTKVAKELAHGVDVVSLGDFLVGKEQRGAWVGDIPVVKHAHAGDGSALAKIEKGVVDGRHGVGVAGWFGTWSGFCG